MLKENRGKIKMKSQLKPVKSIRLRSKGVEVDRCGDGNRAQDKVDIHASLKKEVKFQKYIIECPICGSQGHSDGRCERDNDQISNRYDEVI